MLNHPILRKRRASRLRKDAPRSRPTLEVLEDRLAPAVYTVNTTQDLSIAAGVNNATGVINGTNGVVTLRSAIQAANSTTGPNTINLALPGTYAITLHGTAGETDNQAGEFSIFPTTPSGDLSLINTSGGAITVDGGGNNRVFDINASNTNNPATHFKVTMQGFTITNGKAFDAANPDGPNGSGGGIRDQGNQSLTLTNMVITNNSASADGGGISMENSVDTPWTLELNNTTVSNNNAGDAGGGIDEDGAGRVNINNSTITGNTTVNQGAGIWLDAATGSGNTAILTITRSIISDNTALNGPTGGIGNAGTNAFVPATGPVVTGAVSIIDSTVANNFSGGAATGGGGFGDEGGTGTLVILNSTFVGNSSTQGGGGVQESGPSTTINDSTFTGNSTLQEGGGLDITSASFILNNSIVAGNLSNGGTMNFAGVNPDVVGAVTTGNGNFIGIGGPGLTGITDGSNGNKIGTAAAPLNPLLGPLQNNGGPTPTKAPLLGSPVIDAGVNGAIPADTTTDQRGFPRIVNNTVDIGAVEFQNASLAVSVVPASSTVALGGTASFAIKVTNTSGNGLPADNSTVLVTLPAGLSATSPLSFTVGALAAGQTATFTVTGTATALGKQTITALVTSPDTNPFSASGSGAVTVNASTAASTAVKITGISDSYTLFSQVEKVTAQVTSGGVPVTTGDVTFTDGGQTQTVAVGSGGTATATFTFQLLQGKEQPNAHTVSAAYNDATTFASSTTSATAGATTQNYLFQLYFDYLLLLALGL